MRRNGTALLCIALFKQAQITDLLRAMCSMGFPADQRAMSSMIQSPDASRAKMSALQDPDSRTFMAIFQDPNSRTFMAIFQDPKVLEALSAMAQNQEYTEKKIFPESLTIKIAWMNGDEPPGGWPQIDYSSKALTPVDIQDIRNDLEKRKFFSELNIRGCGVKDSVYKEFSESNCTVKKVDTSANKTLEKFDCLAVFVKKSKVISLDMSECDMDDDKLEDIEKSFCDFKLNHLDVSYSEFSKCDHIAKLVKRCNIQELDLIDCRLTELQLNLLASGLGKHQMKRIDMSHNKEITAEGFKVLAKLINDCGLKEIAISGCEVDDDKMKSFCGELDSKNNLSHLHAAYNEELKEEGISALAKLCQTCDLESLSLAGCDLTHSELSSFKNESEKCHKLTSLNLSDNPQLAFNIAEVAKLVRSFSVQIFNFSECFLRAWHVEEFAKALDDHKFRILDISEQDWPLSEGHASALENLIPCVQEEIKMVFSSIDEKLLNQLHERRDRENPNLNIKNEG